MCARSGDGGLARRTPSAEVRRVGRVDLGFDVARRQPLFGQRSRQWRSIHRRWRAACCPRLCVLRGVWKCRLTCLSSSAYLGICLCSWLFSKPLHRRPGLCRCMLDLCAVGRLLQLLGEWQEYGSAIIFVNRQVEADELFTELLKVNSLSACFSALA